MNLQTTDFIDLSTRTGGDEPLASGEDITWRAADVARMSGKASRRTFRLHPLPRPVAIDQESARWSALLDMLEQRTAEGALTMPQKAAFLHVWEKATGRISTLRRPAVGLSDDGILHASWSFADLPGEVYTLDVMRDGSLEWFYRPKSGPASGSDEPTAELPERALVPLAMCFSLPRRAPGAGSQRR
jgi:hypothetical protein